MTDTPPPPDHLTGAALECWHSTAPTLAERRSTKPSTWTLLASYCAATQRLTDAEAWLADPDHGPVITIRDDKGNIKSHGPAPQLAIAERAAKEVSRLAKELRI